MSNSMNPRVSAVVFDWAGTTIDFGCCAPAKVFQSIFEDMQVPVTAAQARGPMGMSKRDHIAAVCALDDVKVRWQRVYGQPVSDADIDAMYAKFLPLQKRILAGESRLIPGVPELCSQLQSRGIRIGATTGYTRELMSVVSPLAAAQGYVPDVSIFSDDVAHGRPAPWMLLEAARQLNAYPLNTIVKVDDTPVGIEAGLNAGTWTVAVTSTGNEMGLSHENYLATDAAVLRERNTAIQQMFLSMGAHFVIDSVADLPDVITQIEERLRISRK